MIALDKSALKIMMRQFAFYFIYLLFNQPKVYLSASKAEFFLLGHAGR